jgi:hypothetical protein
MYATGRGVAKDLARAVHLYHQVKGEGVKMDVLTCAPVCVCRTLVCVCVLHIFDHGVHSHKGKGEEKNYMCVFKWHGIIVCV